MTAPRRPQLHHVHRFRNRGVSENALLRLMGIVTFLGLVDEMGPILDKFPDGSMRKRRWAAMVNLVNRGLHSKIKPHKWTATH